MTDQHYIDPEGFSLERFRQILETGEVLPGRTVLKENIPERFAVLESMGIRNLKELIDALGSKKRVETFSQDSGLPKDYLVILKREATSYLPKPVNLRVVPGLDVRYVASLDAVGIKHSKHLFERATSKTDRAALSELAGVPGDDLLEIVRMSDLAKIGGVGPVFARILYEAGVGSLEELARWSPEDLFERLHAVNDEKYYTRAMISLKDVRHCIETARELPKVIEYW